MNKLYLVQIKVLRGVIKGTHNEHGVEKILEHDNGNWILESLND